jgi:hypothetical protein
VRIVMAQDLRSAQESAAIICPQPAVSAASAAVVVVVLLLLMSSSCVDARLAPTPIVRGELREGIL